MPFLSVHAAPEGFERGVGLFNAGHYFEAHEAWEDVWRAAPAGDRDFYQGLIHLTVALYQAKRHNWRAAHSQLRRASRKLGRFEPQAGGIALRGLRDSAADAVLRLQCGSSDIRWPRIVLARDEYG